MLQGILFDLDGVLVDSEPLYFRAVKDSFAHYGIEITEEEYVRRWMIERTHTRGALKDRNLNIDIEELRGLKERLFLEYVKGIQMIPKAMDLLERYDGKYPYGLISSEVREMILKKTEKFDLIRFFKISVAGDEVKKGKPDPEPYRKGCELLGLDPKYVLVIEDNPTGVIAGNAAGCKTIAYPNGFTARMDFSLANARVKSLYEINDELIERIMRK
jgi:HAD superfamily hydrolase (TIGR01509 family)